MALCAVCAQAQFRPESWKDLNESDTSTKLKEHVGFLSSAMLEGRLAGSEGEKEAAEYVKSELADCGIDLFTGTAGETFGMKMEAGDTLTSRNVLGFIPGYDKNLKNEYIVIGARLDNMGTRTVNVNGEDVVKTFYGANGNASGLALLIELARMLNTNKVLLKRSVIIAAFGASSQMFAGSWYMLNRSFSDADKISAMVNLDMLGTGSRGFYAYTASNEDLNAMVNELAGTLQPVRPKLVSLEPVGSDHRSFYNKEIPAVMFTTGMYPEYNTDKDTGSIIEYGDMERELEYIYNFTLKLVNGTRPAFRSSEDNKKRYVLDRDVYPYYECDGKPTFLGSSDPADFLRKWVYTYLKYPKQAQQNGVQGKVLVDFIINEKGKVTDVTVQKSADPLLDEEAVRVISASPDWKPGRIKGQKVKCEMSVTVEFKLEKKR